MTGNGGDTAEDTVTATATDNEGNSVKASDTAGVEIVDTPPRINVDKSASPASVTAPGGNVTFTIVVRNDSVESVTLDEPRRFAVRRPQRQGTCSLPRVLAPGARYSCAFTTYVAGSSGSFATDTVTGTAIDDDGNTASDSDSATVGVGGGGGSAHDHPDQDRHSGQPPGAGWCLHLQREHPRHARHSG